MNESNDPLDLSILKTTLAAKINSSYSQLSSKEKKIADYVMERPDQVIYSSVTQIADELNIAQSTVTKFCRSVGLRGFQELKIMLAKDLNTSPASSSSDAENMTLPQRLAQISISNIQETLKIMDLNELHDAVNKILDARKILIFGMGESGPITKLLKIKLFGLALTVDAHEDSHLQMISSAHLTKDDLVIGISYNGNTKDVVNALQSARKSGATAICISGHGRSPITEVSDIQLICLSKGRSVFENEFKSKVSMLFLIELIESSISLHLQEKGKGLEPWKTTESILDKLY